MRKNLWTISLLAGVAAISACSAGPDNVNGNAANVSTANTAPVNSTVSSESRTSTDAESVTTRTTDANGTVTETRTFSNHPRVSKVVVTTDRSGKRVARVYSNTDEVKE